MKGEVNIGTGMTEGQWAEHLYATSDDPKLCQGQIVKFNLSDSCNGVGKICGIANNGAAVIGKAYIIEILSSNIDKKIYPYSHLAVFEHMIKTVIPKGDWVVEWSSGSVGYRCKKCGTWIYGDSIVIECECDK